VTRSTPRLWTRVADRLAHREAGTSLALFRIAMGLAVLYTLVPIISNGVLQPLFMDLSAGGFRPLRPDNWLVEALGGATQPVVTGLFATGILSGLCLVLGLGGRLTALVALQVMMAIFALNPASGGGHDRLHTNGLWLLVLAPSTATLSLDARLFGPDRRFVSQRPVAAWPRYLAIYQLVIVYGTTGIQKLSQEWMPWGDFTALYYALLAPSWQRWDTSFIGHPAVFFGTQLGTAITWLWETLAPIWLLAFWFRATRDRPGRLRAAFNRVDLRSWWAAFGIALHCILWATMNLGPFSLVTMGFYLCLWHPDEYAALWRRVWGRGSARVWRRPQPLPQVADNPDAS